MSDISINNLDSGNSNFGTQTIHGNQTIQYFGVGARPIEVAPPPTPQIFLAAARDASQEEAAFLRRLHTDLTAAGYTLWWDQEAQASASEIREAIIISRRVLLVVGPQAMGENARATWQMAHASRSFLFCGAKTAISRQRSVCLRSIFGRRPPTRCLSIR